MFLTFQSLWKKCKMRQEILPTCQGPLVPYLSIEILYQAESATVYGQSRAASTKQVPNVTSEPLEPIPEEQNFYEV